MSAPPGAGTTMPARRPRSAVRTFFGGALILCALGGLALTAVFGWFVFGDDASVRNPAYRGVAWRNEPATTLFPDRLSAYRQGDPQDPRQRRMEWVRAALSADTRCATGLEPAALKLAEKYGCQAVLRATYVDATNTQVATVGVIVIKDAEKDEDGYMPSELLAKPINEAGDGYEAAEGHDRAAFTVRALAAPGTPAARWNDAARNATYAESTDNYTIAVTVGTTDGRRAARLPAPWDDAGVLAATRDDRASYLEGAKGLSESYVGSLLRVADGDGT